MERLEEIRTNFTKLGILLAYECERYSEIIKLKLAQQIERQNFMVLCHIIIPVIILVTGFNSIATGAFAYNVENMDKEESVVVETLETQPAMQETIMREEEILEETIAVVEVTSDEKVKMKTLEDAKEEVKEEETQPAVIPVISAYEAGEVYYYNATYEEKILLAKLVYVEARGECFEGKVAVAAVVLNRYMSGRAEFYTDSIYNVITQPGAFASTYGVTEAMLEAVPECMEAVEAALKGWDPTRELFETGACFFYAPAIISAEAMVCRQGVPTLNIGNHAFHNEFN